MSVIPKEQVAGFQRWQVDAFDRPDPQRAAPVDAAGATESAPPPNDAEGEPVADFKLPTAEDLERMHADAQQQGYQAGLENGRQEGYEAGMAAARAEAEQIQTLGDHFRTALDQLDQQVADQVLELALEVAHQLVRSTLSAEPERLLPIIREAIAALPLHHGTIALHLHPADAALLHSLLGNQIGQSGWHLIEDADITRGGCQLRAGTSEVDATLETRWKRVLETIGNGPSATHDAAA